MKRSLFSLMALALAGHAAASTAPVADGPNLDYVAADATWVVHVDVQAFANSKLGQKLLDESSGFDIREGLDDARSKLDVDPLKLIRWVTLYGDGKPDDGPEVVIAETTDALDDLVDKVREHASEYRTTAIGDYEVHAWEDGYAHIRKRGERRLLVFTDDDDHLLRAIKVIDDDAASVEDKDAMSLDERDGLFLFAKVVEFSWMDRENEKMSVVADKARALSLQLGESEGKAWADLSVALANEQDARDLAEIAQGFVAFGRMVASEDDELRRYESLIRSIRINASGASLSLQLDFDPDQILFEGQDDDHEDRDEDDDDDDDDDDDWGRNAF